MKVKNFPGYTVRIAFIVPVRLQLINSYHLIKHIHQHYLWKDGKLKTVRIAFIVPLGLQLINSYHLIPDIH